MGKYVWIFAVLAAIATGLMVSTCDNDDDDNDDDNDAADDDSDDDDDDNDDSGYPPEYTEKPNCQGYDYPECGTDVDVAPVLTSVTVLVGGVEVAQPATVQPGDELDFALEYEFPNHKLCGGHLFLVKNGHDYCMDNDGFPTDENYTMELPGICSTADYGQPVVWPFDPSLFLNGEGAPYYIEISNDCATHSNRIEVQIVTVE